VRFGPLIIIKIRAVVKPQYKLSKLNMNCLPDTSSWCAWLCADALRTLEDFKHDYQFLKKKFLEIIKPIYEDFLRDLLIRCSGANTQNSKRKFERDDLVFCIKHLHAGLKIIEIVTFRAMYFQRRICLENNIMSLKIGKRTEIFAQQDRRHRSYGAPTLLKNADGQINKQQVTIGLWRIFWGRRYILCSWNNRLIVNLKNLFLFGKYT